MTRAVTFTDDTIYDLAREGFLHELGVLVQITQSRWFWDLFPAFLTYKAFLSSTKHNFLDDRVLGQLLKRQAPIDALERGGDVEKLFLCANLAASCEIFSGWTIPVNELDPDRTGEYLQLALANAAADRTSLGRNMAQRLNNGDTVRIIQALKLLGLIRVDTNSYHQLSLGASIGRRDCHALHLEPALIPTTAATSPATPPPLRFSVRPGAPRDIVLMDNDPALVPVYERLNADPSGAVTAMNIDLHDGLEKLAQTISEHQLPPRTLIAAFRIEPRAFADIGFFLRSIGTVIDEQADFVMTIGSGDTDDEFRHRLEVLNGISENLDQNGMQPVRIEAYQGETLAEQRARPAFGLNQYASYETLYCRLERSKLAGQH